jgi:hypothetical protein
MVVKIVIYDMIFGSSDLSGDMVWIAMCRLGCDDHEYEVDMLLGDLR